MDRQPGLVLDVFIGCLVPFFVGMAELRVVADLVLLADIGDPAVEGVERRAVAQESRFADRITTVDVKPKTIGSRLAAKILFVIEHPKAAPEVSYVSSEVLYRGVLASDPKASNPDESIL